MSIQVEFVPIDKEQPTLPLTATEMAVIPFPGEEIELLLDPAVTIRVIRRVFLLTHDPRHQGVRLFVRVLPPQGTP